MLHFAISELTNNIKLSELTNNITSFSLSLAIFVSLVHLSAPILNTNGLTLRYFPWPQPTTKQVKLR